MESRRAQIAAHKSKYKFRLLLLFIFRFFFLLYTFRLIFGSFSLCYTRSAVCAYANCIITVVPLLVGCFESNDVRNSELLSNRFVCRY